MSDNLSVAFSGVWCLYGTEDYAHVNNNEAVRNAIILGRQSKRGFYCPRGFSF